jgi:hypothetical protein
MPEGDLFERLLKIGSQTVRIALSSSSTRVFAESQPERTCSSATRL